MVVVKVPFGECDGESESDGEQQDGVERRGD